ncbi:hypothetical protein [Microvirga sp. VF16]|uniref:hypothetical protein n=1 Tax=Microvirga sp. VF16 TaxID=2807101 RepID=UPI00193EC0F8|nr:hypothetical protein [Microvirga sp. VF16]QRM35092.1 hypothetical protein JO965_39515 [Microvirga sp. VF16]
MKLLFKSATAVLLLASTSAMALSDTDREAAIKAAKAGPVGRYIECGVEMGSPVELDVTPMDLNADGVEEVMITASHENGGAACFSHLGMNKTLMIRNRKGEWIANLGFDAQEIKALPDRSNGYQDLAVDLAGDCWPVWRHNATEYHIYKQCQKGKLVIASSWKAGGSQPKRLEDTLGWDNDQLYIHNGSGMYVNMGTGIIRYAAPKESIAGTVKEGTVLFRGEFKNAPGLEARGTVNGTAYVFKKGCEPAPYQVSGTYNAWSVTMKGAAPRRAKDSCAVLEATKNSPHAVLKFEAPPDY